MQHEHYTHTAPDIPSSTALFSKESVFRFSTSDAETVET